MIRNYFKITYRNLLRQKVYAFINIFGLSIGITCSVLIGLYVQHEYSYDKFHKDADRMYRVILDFKMGTNVLSGPISPAPMASEIMKQLPEVEEVVRIRQIGNRAVRIDNRTFYEDQFFYVDSNFFSFFGIKFISGNPGTALNRPHTVVITAPVSKKLFGTVHSIGKTFHITNNDSSIYEVTGVVDPFPENTHFHFDYLASMSGLPDSRSPFWLANNYYTYLKLKTGTSEKEFNRKLTDLFATHASPQLLKFFNITAQDFANAGNRSDYAVQKVTDIHLKSNLNFELEDNGNAVYVYIFVIVALFVLLNACINFTNLSTARSASRAKEVGLRKVLGSNRSSIIFQFMAESVMISYLSVFLAILMIELLLPHFNTLLNVSIHLSLVGYLRLLPYIILFATFVGLISGAYPALYLSAFNPNEVLKNKFFHGATRNWLRNSLVTIQFTVSIVILLGTMLVASQLRYLQNKNMGFDTDRLLVVERTNPIIGNMKAFLEELQKCPSIESVSLSSGIPGRETGDQGFTMEGRSSTDIFVINTYGVNYEYANTLGIKIKQGRFFSREYSTDSTAVVINESTARYLGLTDPIGQEIINSAQGEKAPRLKIIGVMEDFHYESLHKPVNPLLLFLARQYYDGYVNIRYDAGKEEDVLEFLNLTWRNLAPGYSIQYFYYRDQFNRMYKNEIETKKLMNSFAVIAILIASLGLFGLVAYMAERRTKEIGVRKVLGASVWQIVKKLTTEITLLVVVAYMIAAPLAYFWMKHWLVQFAYKTPVNAAIFVLAFVIAIVIAWLTVSVIAIKSATRNPVEALRYE